MAMGIKCSLFGHAYGETTVERDREEDGSEVVITIREVEICRRCGETRIVSENKEVTTIETPADVATGAADTGDDSTADASSGPGIVDAEAGEPVSGSDATGPGEDVDHPEVDDPSPDLDDAEVTSAAEDDGVILEDSDDEPDRDPGEWPDREDEQSERTERPDESPATEGIERFTDDAAEADVTDDDPESAEILDETAESGGNGDVTQPDVGTDEAATVGDEPREDSEVWSEQDPDLAGERPGGTVTVPDGRFRCPVCDFRTPVESSSLREGDFCPECHEGSLVHESG